MTFYDYPPTLGTAPVTNGKATITTQGMILDSSFSGCSGTAETPNMPAFYGHRWWYRQSSRPRTTIQTSP